MKTSIFRKIFFSQILVFSLVLGTVFFYLRYNLTNYTFNNINQRLYREIKLVQPLLEKQLDQKNFELSEFTKKLHNISGLRISLISLEGTVQADSAIPKNSLKNLDNHLSRPEVQLALKQKYGESKRYSNTLKEEILYLATLYQTAQNKGVLRLAIPLTEIRYLSRQVNVFLFISLIFAFIAGIIISFIVSFYISLPIKEINQATKKITQGDYSVRCRTKSKDELGQLAVQINSMVLSIQKHIKAINLETSQLEAIFESMFDGIMVIDKSGRILLMNPTLKAMFNIKRETKGKNILGVIRNLEVKQIADKTLERISGVESKIIKLIVDTGKVIKIHGSPIRSQDVLEGAVLIFHDITRIQQLEKIRQEFVANVSHELRTPTTNILGYAETLLNGAIAEPQTAREFMGIIHQNALQLNALLKDILDLSKIESGKIEIKKTSFELSPLIKTVIQNMELIALKMNSVSIINNIPENLPLVYADKSRITQVLINLFDNAIKYNKKNGQVSITAIMINSYIEICVADTGIGIPAPKLTRVFERFYRVDKNRSREIGGTGLGLSIVKHIIQLHTGTVRVESTPDKGSKFYFTLPVG